MTTNIKNTVELKNSALSIVKILKDESINNLDMKDGNILMFKKKIVRDILFSEVESGFGPEEFADLILIFDKNQNNKNILNQNILTKDELNNLNYFINEFEDVLGYGVDKIKSKIMSLNNKKGGSFILKSVGMMRKIASIDLDSGLNVYDNLTGGVQKETEDMGEFIGDTGEDINSAVKDVLLNMDQQLAMTKKCSSDIIGINSTFEELNSNISPELKIHEKEIKSLSKTYNSIPENKRGSIENDYGVSAEEIESIIKDSKEASDKLVKISPVESSNLTSSIKNKIDSDISIWKENGKDFKETFGKVSNRIEKFNLCISEYNGGVGNIEEIKSYIVDTISYALISYTYLIVNKGLGLASDDDLKRGKESLKKYLKEGQKFDTSINIDEMVKYSEGLISLVNLNSIYSKDSENIKNIEKTVLKLKKYNNKMSYYKNNFNLYGGNASKSSVSMIENNSEDRNKTGDSEIINCDIVENINSDKKVL